jgi:uncharacterized membrane protein
MIVGQKLPTPAPVADDELRAIESLVSYLLRGGVAISSILVLFGTIVSYVHHPDYVKSHLALKQLTEPREPLLHNLHEVAAAIVDFRGQAIVMAGLLILIATPICRVATLIMAFLYRGDRLFALLGTIVLCLLLLSFVLGKAG